MLIGKKIGLENRVVTKILENENKINIKKKLNKLQKIFQNTKKNSKNFKMNIRNYHNNYKNGKTLTQILLKFIKKTVFMNKMEKIENMSQKKTYNKFIATNLDVSKRNVLLSMQTRQNSSGNI